MTTPFGNAAFPTQGLSAWETGGDITTTTNITLLTSSSNANDKGSYTQLIASTARKATWITIILYGDEVSNDTNRHLVDIATGGAGSEIVLLSNIFHIESPASNNKPYSFPISIPSGTRVSARTQAQAASGKCRIEIFLGGTPQ